MKVAYVPFDIIAAAMRTDNLRIGFILLYGEKYGKLFHAVDALIFICRHNSPSLVCVPMFEVYYIPHKDTNDLLNGQFSFLMRHDSLLN
jgi:hypothetical protein